MSTTVAAAAAQRLDRRRVYIFPTRAGFTFGVMLVIILLGAINYDNALGYLLAFLLGGLVMVAMLYTYRNLVGLSFHGAQAQPVFAGEDAHFVCVFENPDPWPRLALAAKYWPRGLPRRARRALAARETGFDVPASARRQVAVRVPTSRRGWCALTRIAVHGEYPLGILRAWAYFSSDARCLVYPAARGMLPLPGARAHGLGHGQRDRRGVDDFAGLRAYVPGDAMRAIAWRTLAKEQQVMAKRFEGSAGAELMLDWAALAAFADVEVRLSQLTAWILAAEAQGLRYGLVLPATTFPPDHGPRHRDACLRALALYGTTP